MADIVVALAPVFILIAIGYGARASNLANSEAFGVVNRFGYFVLYPAFLFTLISTADVVGMDAGPFVLAVVLGFAVMCTLALTTRLIFRENGPAFTSVFQGSARWNGFALLAAAPDALRADRCRHDRAGVRANHFTGQCGVRVGAGALGRNARGELARDPRPDRGEPADPGVRGGTHCARAGRQEFGAGDVRARSAGRCGDAGGVVVRGRGA